MIECLVSVIIPAYNREDTIVRAIDSVLKQTYQNIEVIIVDDCSTDNTEMAVKSIHDNRLSYYKLNKNSGACVARNEGVKISKGTIVAFQDSDDFWHSDKLAKQLQFMETHNYEFVSCGFRRVSGSRYTEHGTFETPIEGVDIWCQLLNSNWISTQTIVCYKYCFDKIAFDPTIKRYQDLDLALQCSQIYKMGHLTEVLVDVYLQENSITNTVKNSSAKLAIIEKHTVDVKDNKNMKAQIFKSLADLNRKAKSFRASKYYWKSFLVKPNAKIALNAMLCYVGFFKLYNTRQ